MFQFQPFTQAEIDADPRLAKLLDDKHRLIEELDTIVRRCEMSGPMLDVALALGKHYMRERQHQDAYDAAYSAALQAENERRGWKPSTFTDILGEPQYDTRIEERDGD